ncbi:hypothetical protein DLJ54_05635 [Corynebacterium heidelbergense]|uniref:DUF218 domain-containing protein n=2 Tax=Corynebacterium heidelbergense TaxID=2055947 RepID=A0A364V5Q4_9CORY|nr:hypothetical protein DLJ54_05635 [Corynebacterium heidelbergense]
MGSGAVLAMGTATAQSSEAVGSGAPSPASLMNGALMLGCQRVAQQQQQVCTDFEQLTDEDPALLTYNQNTADIVVLGAGLKEDGSMRDILEQRLRTGLRLANKFPNARLIVTGGVPQNGRTEAQAMYDWLTGAGVKPERITREGDSTNTVQNAQFTDKILRDRDTSGAIVVTNDFHLKRAMLNFRQAVNGRIPVAGVVAR